jgi:hypothetical protein
MTMPSTVILVRGRRRGIRRERQLDDHKVLARRVRERRRKYNRRPLPPLLRLLCGNGRRRRDQQRRGASNENTPCVKPVRLKRHIDFLRSELV